MSAQLQTLTEGDNILILQTLCCKESERDFSVFLVNKLPSWTEVKHSCNCRNIMAVDRPQIILNVRPSPTFAESRIGNSS